ncbi:Translin, partial [Armadillidium nasatum]
YRTCLILKPELFFYFIYFTGYQLKLKMSELIEIFQSYADEIEKESHLKESISTIVKDLEKNTFMATTLLEKVHHSQGLQRIDSIAIDCEAVLKNIPDIFKVLSETIPPGEFYRFHYQFRYATQKLVFVFSFLTYLKENRLATYYDIASSLGLKVKREEGLHLDLEDYLQGTLFLSSELARLSINAVSAGDYSRPFQISHFIRDLNSSYALLNPKGDLRKRYDELKYSLKKTEEVVYNLTLRGLKPVDSECEDKSG